MDLHDKIKRSNGSDSPQPAPFRQSGANRGNFIQPNQQKRNPNRQPPRSVQYQYDEIPDAQEQQYDNAAQPIPTYNEGSNSPVQQQMNEAYVPYQQTPYQQTPYQQSGFVSEQGQPFPQDAYYQDGTMPATPVLPNFGIQNNNAPAPAIPQQPAQPMPIFQEPPMPAFEAQKAQPIGGMPSSAEIAQEIPVEQSADDLQEEFLASIENLFNMYEIDKVLIVDNHVYTASFCGEEENEIFDEEIDATLLKKFLRRFVPNGYFEAMLDNGCKVELIGLPISEQPIILASKVQTDFLVDEEFISIVFEFLTKGKNIAMLSNFAIDTLYKVTSDFFHNRFCVTINEPIKTENNVAFKEDFSVPSLKTVFSIAGKIGPDNTLIYSPADMSSTVAYMKKNNGVVLFSDATNPSDFINAEVIPAIGGQNEYSKISVLRAIDIVFSVTCTKNGTTKYTATQLLSPSNKSHLGKIKRIVGDGEIDMNKIYFHNVFEKEV